MKRCKRCKKEGEKLRRGMCIVCYRISTGLSGGDGLIRKLKKEIIQVKNRVSFMELQLKQIEKQYEKRKQ